MINITINADGSTSQDVISLGSQFENLDEVIQFTFPSDLEPLNKYVVAKTYDSKKKENITRVTPLVDNKFIIGQAITKVTGQWLLYTLCKAYSPNGDIERVSISDPIVATVTENGFDISEIETAEIDPNIKIIYDELKALKKELETNEATRQTNEATRVEAENVRLSNETARANAEQARQTNEAQRAENEVNRASAETARANAETARTNAEAKRATAETARTTAEANRVIAEQSRVNAEQLRVTADEQREDNTNNAIKAMTDSTNKAIDTLNEKIGIIDGLRTDIDANTKEDANTRRVLNALWDLNKGISYRFENDSTKAYQKTVPTGAKLGAVNAIGGRTIVYNQYANINGTMKLWADDSGFYKNIKELSGHKLYIMNKCAVTKILYDKETYYKRLILFNENDDGVVNVGNTVIKKADMAVGKVFTSKEIVQAPSTLRKIRLYNIGDDITGLTAECDSWVNVIDLTKIYGSGNEPSTVEEFEKLFPNDYYPYNEGTLMSMGTSEVVEQGKNYFDFSKLDSKLIVDGVGAIDHEKQTITIPPKIYYCTFKQKLRDLCPNIVQGEYVVSMNRSNLESDNTIYLTDGTGKHIHLNSITNLTNSDLDSHVVFYNSSTSENENVISNIQFEKASTATTYSSYHEATCQIPQAILNIEGYGWGAGTAYNYVDYESKTFHKCVGRINLDDYTWSAYQRDEFPFYYVGVVIDNLKQTTNILSLTGIRSLEPITDATRLVYPSGTILDDSNKPTGYLYYELATPIVTDISDIIGDTFKEPFEVEGGGSLTFKNVNDDGYNLAVPSHVKYVVSLKEVTG